MLCYGSGQDQGKKCNFKQKFLVTKCPTLKVLSWKKYNAFSACFNTFGNAKVKGPKPDSQDSIIKENLKILFSYI